MKKIISEEDLTRTMADRLTAARIAAGFVKRADVFERYPSWSEDTYASHELGRRRFGRAAAAKYATAFKVSVPYLMAHDVDEGQAMQIPAELPTRPRPRSNASFPPVYQSFNSGSTIPLLGQSAGGPNGRFILNGNEVGRVFCPPMLEGVEGAYAVRVYGTSMVPRFLPAETVWINPHEPVRSGDDVVVQLVNDREEHSTESYIKQFRSQSSKVLRLYQHNPEEGEKNDIEFDADDVFSVHKIVFHAV